MRFQGRHGVYEWEQLTAQPFEVDVELMLDLQPAGLDDDLELSVDYGRVYDAVRQIVESTSFRLLEALAEAISHELLADLAINDLTLLDGALATLAHALQMTVVDYDTTPLDGGPPASPSRDIEPLRPWV